VNRRGETRGPTGRGGSAAGGGLRDRRLRGERRRGRRGLRCAVAADTRAGEGGHDLLSVGRRRESSESPAQGTGKAMLRSEFGQRGACALARASGPLPLSLSCPGDTAGRGRLRAISFVSGGGRGLDCVWRADWTVGVGCARRGGVPGVGELEGRWRPLRRRLARRAQRGAKGTEINSGEVGCCFGNATDEERGRCGGPFIHRGEASGEDGAVGGVGRWIGRGAQSPRTTQGEGAEEGGALWGGFWARSRYCEERWKV